MNREASPLARAHPRGNSFHVFTSSRFTLLSCALLLITFATLSYFAACTKSATSDEVVHAPAGYTHLRYFDYRVNPEHPPLWKYWEALPWLFAPPADPNVTGPAFADITKDPANHWAWAVDTLYHTPGNDPVRLIGMSRAMMLVPAIALGALLAWWAYKLAGPVAAVTACALYCLDPNFLAHASLVTNDVSFALATLLLSYCLWLLGRRLTAPRAAAAALCCGAAFVTKYTALLLAPTLVLVLIARALLPSPWPRARGRAALDTRPRRMAAAIALSLLCAATTYACIWAAYGFRFRTAPDPAVRPDLALITRDAVVNEIMGTTGHGANEQDIRDWRPSLYIRGCLFAIEHHLVPEPFAYGILFAYSKSLYRWSYLLGQISGRGHWYYFPVAFLVKTPLATLAAVLVLPFAALALRLRKSPPSTPGQSDGSDSDHSAAPDSPSSIPQSAIRNPQFLWLAACLAIPFVLLGYFSIRSHMNLGIRHIFPLYPILYLAAAVAAARLYAARPKLLRVALPLLGVALAAETLPAYPDYIPFFNTAVGGYRGGFRILGDSNLDWGQDLPLLAKWQQAHPDRTLYLAYNGTADPAYYKIRYVPLTLNTGFQVTRRVFPTRGGVVAASATMLQNDWLRPEAQAFFHRLRDTPPTEILGGSIYLFDLDNPR